VPHVSLSNLSLYIPLKLTSITFFLRQLPYQVYFYQTSLNQAYFSNLPPSNYLCRSAWLFSIKIHPFQTYIHPTYLYQTLAVKLISTQILSTNLPPSKLSPSNFSLSKLVLFSFSGSNLRVVSFVLILPCIFLLCFFLFSLSQPSKSFARSWEHIFKEEFRQSRLNNSLFWPSASHFSCSTFVYLSTELSWLYPFQTKLSWHLSNLSRSRCEFFVWHVKDLVRFCWVWPAFTSTHSLQFYSTIPSPCSSPYPGLPHLLPLPFSFHLTPELSLLVNKRILLSHKFPQKQLSRTSNCSCHCGQAYFTLRMQQETLDVEREYVVLCHGISGCDLGPAAWSILQTLAPLDTICGVEHCRADQEWIEGRVPEDQLFFAICSYNLYSK